MHTLYDPEIIENKWQKKWDQEKNFKASKNYSKKKYYLLEMFPYPSGKIHMGHVRVYTIGDVIARYRRMCGYNVLHPMGWDAFGMPAENAAIESNTHPAKWTYANINNMKSQLKRLGFSYDWDRELTTCKPEYYRWEQWLFIKMLKNGMVYRKKSYVNWCKKCDTVLANEQVSAGTCWRCGNIVIQKKLWQWFFRITDHADNLLMHCDQLSGWPKKVTKMQKNWIGKSFGTTIDFKIEGIDNSISVFTTRPDTIFGVTFISISKEHPIVPLLSDKYGKSRKILNFINKFNMGDKLLKVTDDYDKDGIFTGAYCINPINNSKIPIYVVNFVIVDYGTGAIMSVPAHDYRDFEFAKKYDLPIKVVIKPDKEQLYNSSFITQAFTGNGIMINSGSFDGLSNLEASHKITEYLEKNKFGRQTISFKLKDWGISRQRYWGTPIPIVYCKSCGIVPVKEEDLPVILPEESNILEGGKSPLSKLDNFINVSCPSCGHYGAKRETDTMDTFVESSWYFERFCSPNYDQGMFDKKAVGYWMPVDQYIGGIEHAILHLLYARYFTRVLNKLGLIDYKEPFVRVLSQGMVCKETLKCPNDGFLFPEETTRRDTAVNCNICGELVKIGRVEKMSKSKKNVIDPNILINKYGADTVRLFCLFTAPPEKDLEWNDQGVEGSSKFLQRVWHIALNWTKPDDIINYHDFEPEFDFLSSPFFKLLQKTHETIKKVTHNIENRSHFNTAISSIMELLNAIYTTKSLNANNFDTLIVRFSLETIILLLYPMVPHFCEELWQNIGKTTFLAKEMWPKYDENIIIKNNILLIVQVNGKLRSRIQIRKNMPEEKVKFLALSDHRVIKFTKNKTIIKTVLIKNKLINIVVK